MADYLDSVKSLATNYRKWAEESLAEKPGVSARHLTYAKNLDLAVAEILECRQRLTPLPTTFGDLTDLPREVLAELNLTKIDEMEQQLRDIVASGDDVGLDAIIIEMYRRHQVIQPRRFVMNKLYRMAQKGIIDAVEGKKGVYRVPKVPKPLPFGGGDWDLDDDVPF